MHVIDIVQDPQEGPRVLISVSGPAVDRTGIAEGFSGSPVLCDDGSGTMRNMGQSPSQSVNTATRSRFVTPIEQILGEPVSPPSSMPRPVVRDRPLAGPLSVGGLSPSLLALVQRAGRRAGRTIVGGPSNSTLSFPAQDLVRGPSVPSRRSPPSMSWRGIVTPVIR